MNLDLELTLQPLAMVVALLLRLPLSSFSEACLALYLTTVLEILALSCKPLLLLLIAVAIFLALMSVDLAPPLRLQSRSIYDR